jgi:WD40 repeat protein
MHWHLHKTDSAHLPPAAASALEYDSDSQRLFVGLGTGLVHEYKLSGDLNRIDPKRTYSAHSSRIMALRFVSETEWILSVSRDKTLQWCCTKTGRKLGSFEAQAWCMDVAYDLTSSYVFIADYSGQINVLRLEGTGFQFITTLKGHQSTLRDMYSLLVLRASGVYSTVFVSTSVVFLSNHVCLV